MFQEGRLQPVQRAGSRSLLHLLVGRGMVEVDEFMPGPIEARVEIADKRLLVGKGDGSRKIVERQFVRRGASGSIWDA